MSDRPSTEIAPLVLELRELGVVCRGEEEIREYLLQYPDLIDLIPLAVDRAKERFPKGQLILSVYTDPEIDDRYLVLYVRLERYDESVIHEIEKVEAKFIDRLGDKAGWLQLTTDFFPKDS